MTRLSLPSFTFHPFLVSISLLSLFFSSWNLLCLFTISFISIVPHHHHHSILSLSLTPYHIFFLSFPNFSHTSVFPPFCSASPSPSLSTPDVQRLPRLFRSFMCPSLCYISFGLVCHFPHTSFRIPRLFRTYVPLSPFVCFSLYIF